MNLRELAIPPAPGVPPPGEGGGTARECLLGSDRRIPGGGHSRPATNPTKTGRKPKSRRRPLPGPSPSRAWILAWALLEA